MAQARGTTTETNPDDIGPDGTVRLRCYLPSANTVWFSASCDGLASCGHVAPIGIRPALRIMGSGEATVGELEQHLRYSRCGIPTRRFRSWSSWRPGMGCAASPWRRCMP